jgi:hypothetical protein
MKVILGTLAILVVAGLIGVLIADAPAQVYGQCKYQGVGRKSIVQAYKVSDMSLVATVTSDDNGNYVIYVSQGLQFGVTYKNYAHDYNDEERNGWSTTYVITEANPVQCRNITLLDQM